jgi:hypothetical protein
MSLSPVDGLVDKLFLHIMLSYKGGSLSQG